MSSNLPISPAVLPCCAPDLPVHYPKCSGPSDHWLLERKSEAGGSVNGKEEMDAEILERKINKPWWLGLGASEERRNHTEASQMWLCSLVKAWESHHQTINTSSASGLAISPLRGLKEMCQVALTRPVNASMPDSTAHSHKLAHYHGTKIYVRYSKLCNLACLNLPSTE